MFNYNLRMIAVICALLISTQVFGQKVFEIGEAFDVDIKITQMYRNIDKTTLNKSKASLVYEKEFYSANAGYVKIYFENFDLAPGDYVEITGSDSNETIIYGGKGKVVDANLNTISDFWSQVLFDEKVTLRLYSSGNTVKYNGFEITQVAYGFSEKKMADIFAKSEGEESICSGDNKEQIVCYQGTEIYNKARAVCRLILNGTGLCTGWLLGSEGHLMTNNHCIGSSSTAQNTDYVFNYQNSNCSGTIASTSDVVATSATFIKTSSSLDYTLVRLPVNPTSTYGYLSISPDVASAGDRIYIPQHPGGRRKEVAVNTGSGVATVNCSGSNCGSRVVTYFADTEGGSSGSPVIDYNSNLVIAIHNTGGCPNGSNGRSDQLISSIGSDMPANGVGGGGVDPDPDPTCSSTVSSFPYSESFEASVGWTQVSGDDGNWVRDSGGTPSSSTGPSGGADGSFYMFLEASTNGSAGQVGSNATVILESPCFDLTGLSTASFSFSNHMYGSNMGSLDLEVSTNGTSWSNLWSLSGNQGNQWNDVSVNLSAYAGQSELKLRFVGTPGARWPSDLAIDNLALSTGAGPGPSCPSIDFTSFTITSFSNQDIDGSNSVSANGSAITLTNNTWKYIPLNYTVTQNTVIEFEFSSTNEGEIHAVGFEDDNNLTPARYFKVYGTQNYGVTNYDNYSGGTVTYVIPVGSSYTGSMSRLVFINDDDAGTGNNSTFSNVKIYEGTCGESTAILENLDERTDILGDEDEDIFSTINIAPNPVAKGSTLTLVGSGNELSGASYSIISMSGRVVDQGVVNETATIAIDLLNTGIYMLRVENGFTKVNKRF
ncbi:MAG: trypsin-like peptidase domain-containing protein, partial [Cyclobacteriaceae bacterium]